MTSGVYAIQCVTNGKYYIGQSKDVYGRLRDHKNKLVTKKHHNRLLQRAYNKYGEDCFIFSTFKECSINELDLYERFYIDLLDTINSGYNLESGGNLYKTISEEAKRKMSLAKIGKPSPHKGKKYSDELRQKLSEAHKGLPNPIKGKKTGKPAWNSGKKGVQDSTRRMPVRVIDTTTNTEVGVFLSKQHFCTEINYKSKNYIKVSDTETKLGKYLLINIANI